MVDPITQIAAMNGWMREQREKKATGRRPGPTVEAWKAKIPQDIDGVWPDEKLERRLKGAVNVVKEFTPLGDVEAMGRVFRDVRGGKPTWGTALDAVSLVPVIGSIGDASRVTRSAALSPIAQTNKTEGGALMNVFRGSDTDNIERGRIGRWFSDDPSHARGFGDLAEYQIDPRVKLFDVGEDESRRLMHELSDDEEALADALHDYLIEKGGPQFDGLRMFGWEGGPGKANYFFPYSRDLLEEKLIKPRK